MPKPLYKIFETGSQYRKKEDRINFFRENWNTGVGAILKIAFDPLYKMKLPEGDPHYKPADASFDLEAVIYNRLGFIQRVFINDHPVQQARKEQLFIQLLESMDPYDAKLLLAAKDGKLPYKNLTADFFREAFPGHLPEKDGQIKE